MQDANVFVMFNDQGSPRGEREVKAPNWWMGMARKNVGKGQLTLNLMLSLDPATVGKQGYSHIFQIGESFEGNPLIDHQHPHDFLMQAAAVWRQPLAKGLTLTLAGAPVGEPALGPIAFMHRSSAAENPMSPLGHHTFDSSHIAMGVHHRGSRARPLPGRVVRLPRRRARREPLGPHGPRRAGFVVDPRLVPPVAGVELPGVARIPEGARRARGRRRLAHDRVGARQAAARPTGVDVA